MLRKYILIFCLSCFPFLSTLSGDFVFDDTEAIINNKDVVSEIWTSTFFNDFWGTNIKSNLSHKSYRPLTTLSFRLNYITSGEALNALHFKITNLFCHSLCCLLLLYVYEVMVKRVQLSNDRIPDISLLAAALFAVHPIHVEAVSGIVGRADILATITFLLSFISYDKSINSIKHSYLFLLSTVIFAGIAMLCKENGITALGYCVIYDIWLKYCYTKKEKHSSKKTFFLVNTKLWKRIAIIFFSAISLLYARWLIMGGMKPEFKPIDNPAAFTSNIFTKVAMYNYIYFLNFLILIWPQWLCYDWSMGCLQLIKDLIDYRIFFIITFNIYGILHLPEILHQSNRGPLSRLLILAVGLLIIPFLPASNILFPVGFVIAERVLYLPSAGYSLLIAIGLRKICSKLNRKKKKAAIAVYVVLILIYSLRSWERALEWQNEYKLFISGLSVCPLNAKIHYNVAKVADAKHNFTWALAEYREAIRLYPDYYQAMNNLANLLKNQRKFTEAELYLRKAISIKEDFPAAWMNLGIVLAHTKRYKESQNAYHNALSYRHNYPDCLYNLGNLYLEVNNTELAAETWLAAINLNPKHTHAWNNLIAMFDNTGQTERALQIIPKALKELPSTPSLLFVIANIFGRINRFQEAEMYFKKAIELFKEKVQAIHYANLGVLYHRWKKYDLAIQMYEQALVIDPLFKSAIKNLALLRK
ncbi:protein O-mannosyl-transferase TMTC4-like [Battus philenor]|uniref:protein O-mannosyl-transferase TMTC4-like n=1 Tax=Battus philenor TaxID=42288 RepID=UPI0035CEDE82